MQRITLVICLMFMALALGVARTEAQNAILVDINKASLAWQWEQEAGGVVTEFLVVCGSKTTSVPGTNRSVAIAQIVPGVGQYTCSVAAANQFGASVAVPSPPFEAGTVPVAPTGVTIVVQ